MTHVSEQSTTFNSETLHILGSAQMMLGSV
jgi:hypothetical protein